MRPPRQRLSPRPTRRARRSRQDAHAHPDFRG
jgi:hypothetical protein